jgi:hypothetical protein
MVAKSIWAFGVTAGWNGFLDCYANAVRHWKSNSRRPVGAAGGTEPRAAIKIQNEITLLSPLIPAQAGI